MSQIVTGEWNAKKLPAIVVPRRTIIIFVLVYDCNQILNLMCVVER